MDPITLVITTALANLSQEVIKDAYTALKTALQAKFGAQSEVVEAVEKLEEKPDSKARQAVLQEEVINVKADQDLELLQIVKTLSEHLKDVTGGRVDIMQDINIRGDRNIVTGQGNVSINK